MFASVARIETVRPVVALASRKGCSMYQIDVKFAFLNWPLHDEMHVKQPPRYEITHQEDKVYRLRKVLYGLKQSHV